MYSGFPSQWPVPVWPGVGLSVVDSGGVLGCLTLHPYGVQPMEHARYAYGAIYYRAVKRETLYAQGDRQSIMTRRGFSCR